MRKCLLIILALAVSGFSFGQISGTFSIPDATYPTIASAIADLNSQGVGTGGVTFNVAAGHSETFSSPTAGLITATGTAANPVVFQKSGSGSNPVITSGTGTGVTDGIIVFSGSDFFTFDGIDLQDNSSNTDATTWMEWGYALFRNSATDGSQNNTIQNCMITLNPMHYLTKGVYSVNQTPYSATELTITTESGQNSNNKFYNNSLVNCYIGFYFITYADPASVAFYDQNNDIGSLGGNTILGTGIAGAAFNPMNIRTQFQNNLIIAKNNITGGGTGNTHAIYGIVCESAPNANTSIYENNITLTSEGTANPMYGIWTNLGEGTNNTLEIYSNFIQNCAYPTATSAEFFGIYDNSGAHDLRIYSNVVDNNVIAGSGGMKLIYATSKSGGTCEIYDNIISNNQRSGAGTQPGITHLYGINVTGSGAVSVHDNSVFGNSAPAQVSFGAYLYGIYCSNSASSQVIYNNNVHDLTVISACTGGNAAYGIYSLPSSSGMATNSVQNNTIYNLNINLTSTGFGGTYGIYTTYVGNIYSNVIHNIQISGTSGYGFGYGFYAGGTGTYQMYKNKIYNVSIAGSSAYYYGMYLLNPLLANVFNNSISDLNTPSSTTLKGLNGIYLNGGTNVNLHFNSIYLNCTNSSTSAFNSSGIYASVNPNVELKNNVVVNTSNAPASTTYIASAYTRSAANLSTYASSSDYNDFYAGTPGANNLIFYDGTNKIQTFTAFQTFVSPREANSISADPLFTSSTDLTPLFGSPVFIAGLKIPSITTDMNDITRTNPPDMGAYQVSLPPSSDTWTGVTSNDWDLPSNWNSGVVPGLLTEATIPGITPYMPTVSYSAVCNNLIMESGATLLGNDNLSVNGTAVVKRTITGNWTGVVNSNTLFHYVSSPVSACTANSFLGSLLNQYDEPTKTWQAIINPSTPLAVGKGYSAAIQNPGSEITFTGGDLNSGDVPVSGLTYTNSGNLNYDGWHLLGNPYPSALDWDLGSWNRVNIDGTVYTWDAAAKQYVCWPAQSGYGTMTDGIIPPEQGFMVHVSGPASAGSLTIPEAARVHSTQPFYKNAVSDLLELKVEGNKYSDRMFVQFRGDATKGFDPEFDAFKLMGGEEAPQIYSMTPDVNLTIHVIPATDKNTVVPLGLQVGAEGNYTITPSEFESFPDGTAIYLEDIKTQQTVKLNDAPVYSFIASPDDPEHRFNLHFNLVGVPGHSSLPDEITIYSDKQVIFVNIPFEFRGNIKVYNLLGILISETLAEGNKINTMQLSSLTGYYIVQVAGDDRIRTGKVFIN